MLPKKFKYQIHNAKKGVVKWIIKYLRHIKSLPCSMFNISINQNMTRPWPQCVHIHHHNINYYTGNVCFVIMHNFHLFISQFRNQIISTQTYVLIYILIFITWPNAVQCMEDDQLFKCSEIYAKFKSIYKKRYFIDEDIYC